jgi:hypothetical protein
MGQKQPNENFEELYRHLYEIMKRQPITYDIIRRESGGLNNSKIAQIITTLSIRYPVYTPAKGIYELLGPG